MRKNLQKEHTVIISHTCNKLLFSCMGVRLKWVYARLEKRNNNLCSLLLIKFTNIKYYYLFAPKIFLRELSKRHVFNKFWISPPKIGLQTKGSVVSNKHCKVFASVYYAIEMDINKFHRVHFNFATQMYSRSLKSDLTRERFNSILSTCHFSMLDILVNSFFSFTERLSVEFFACRMFFLDLWSKSIWERVV